VPRLTARARRNALPSPCSGVPRMLERVPPVQHLHEGPAPRCQRAHCAERADWPRPPPGRRALTARPSRPARAAVTAGPRLRNIVASPFVTRGRGCRAGDPTRRGGAGDDLCGSRSRLATFRRASSTSRSTRARRILKIGSQLQGTRDRWRTHGVLERSGYLAVRGRVPHRQPAGRFQRGAPRDEHGHASQQ